MLTTKVYTADGSTRVFQSDRTGKVNSSFYLAVFLGDASPTATPVALDKYTLINNAVVFRDTDIPSSGTTVTVQTATEDEGALQSPYAVSTCAANITSINNAASNAATATTKAFESLSSAGDASSSATQAFGWANAASTSADDADDALQSLLNTDLVDWTSTGAEVIHTDRYTNTVYDPTTNDAAVALNTLKVGITTQQASDITNNNNKVSNVSHPTVEVAVPSGALFTDSVLANITDFTSGTGVEVNTALTIGGTKVPKVFVQTSAPTTGHTAGDLWVDSDGYSSYIAIAIGSGFVWFST